MRNILAAGGLSAALLFACACSVSVGTNNSAGTAPANAASPAQPASAANAQASNTAGAANANAPSSQEGANQDFTLVNSTGVEINKVFISPHDTDDWEEDILGRDTLPSGESVDIKFHRSEKAAKWDLRVEDMQGNAIEWENLNLLEISKVTLHYDKDKGRARADTE